MQFDCTLSVCAFDLHSDCIRRATVMVMVLMMMRMIMHHAYVRQRMNDVHVVRIYMTALLAIVKNVNFILAPRIHCIFITPTGVRVPLWGTLLIRQIDVCVASDV